MRQKTDNEIWKDVKGFEGYYQISSNGIIKSLSRLVHAKNGCVFRLKERILTFKPAKNGYYRTTLCKDGKLFYVLVHKLLAEAFIPNINNKPCINHIDANPSNNKLSNLEWCTHSENTKHAYKIGNLSKVGELNHMNKLSEKEVMHIFKSKLSKSYLIKKYKVSLGTINDIKSGRRWSWVTGKKPKRYYTMLDEKTVIEILSQPNVYYKDLAAKYNVSVWSIFQIRSGRQQKRIFNEFKQRKL